MENIEKSKKIILFPGCFDPIHKQHKKIIEELIEISEFDEVWILINKNSEEKDLQVTFQNRFKMVTHLFEKNPKIKIWDKPISFYTKTVILELKKTFPKYHFSIILGSDQAQKLEKWENAKNLENLVTIWSIDREGYEIPEKLKKKYKIRKLFLNKINNINSNSIKKGCNWKNLDPKIKNFILKEKLYFNNILKNSIQSQSRYQHSQKVAKLARKIALDNNYSNLAEKAYFAGLFHDLTKEWNDIDSKFFWKKHNQEIDIFKNFPKPVWHGYLAALFCEKEMIIEDQDILDAIRFHTTAHPQLSTLGKILFIADKLEESKKHEVHFQKPQALLKKNKSTIDEIFTETLIGVLQKLKFNKKKPTQITIDTYNKFRN